MSKAKVTIEQLFELGAHFGHRKRFWNPHMEDYIFCEKNNIHIINLYKTQEKILELYDTFKNLSAVGNKIMIVGTKRVASSYVKDFGEKTGMPYISHRWLGGMLTNWKTIKIPINKLLEFEENKSSGQLGGMIKKEAVQLEKEMKKLSLNFDGVKDMKGLPDALFVIDVENENIAVEEALKMGIPVYGLVDTNSNPKNLTNFVPINDDSSKTIKFVLDLLSEAVLDGQDSARKQGLVQKLDGDKGPKVFSLNTTTKKVSVKPVEENVEKEKNAVLSQEQEVQNEQPPKVEEKAEVQETSAKMTKSALAKLTKAQLEEKAKELGITIEGKVLKADLVEQVFKAQ